VFKKIACAAEISGAIDNPSTSLLAGCLADCLCVAAYAALSNEAARTQIHTATQKEVLAHTDAHRYTPTQPHTVAINPLRSRISLNVMVISNCCCCFRLALQLLLHVACCWCCCCCCLLLLLLQRQTLEFANNARWR